MRDGSSGPASGETLFARYAYPPNALGYCGPPDAGPTWSAAIGSVPRTRHLAAAFDGAWPYLVLLAGSNGIADPLDPRVVEAYWVGNELVHAVSPVALGALAHRLGHPSGAGCAAAAPAAGMPQHSFHVFAVYPWLGLLRKGRVEPALHVLDQCRIRGGRVEEVDGDHALVTSRCLAFDGHDLSVGVERVERVRHRVDGVGFIADLHRGDVVAMHWDWICDRLPPTSARSLAACTEHNLAAVNPSPAPPAPTTGD